MSAKQVLAVAMVAGALSQVAVAGVTYSNLGPGGAHDYQFRYSSDNIFPEYWAELAWRFTASESGFLTSARLGIYRTRNVPVLLTLYADNGTEPGVALASWTFTPPASPPAGPPSVMSLGNGPRVEAGMQYYIAVRGLGSFPGWDWYSAMRGPDGQFPTTRMGQRPGAGGPWDMFEPTPTMPGFGALPAFELRVETCSGSDYNGDGDFGTDADIEAFFACLSGDCCATCFAGGADFNGDGDVGTDADIEAFFRVLGGGAC